MTNEEELLERRSDSGGGISLERMVVNVNGRVTALEAEVNIVANTQLRHETKLDQIIDSISDGKEVNWSGWASVAIGVLLAIAALVGYTQGFVGLSLTPVIRDQDRFYAEQVDMRERINTLEKEASQWQEHVRVSSGESQ